MAVKYKTQSWLEKYGWEEGMGLGKNLDGRSDIVHVSQKKDLQGLGVKNYELLDFAHWDNIYTKAANKIHITTSEQGVVLKKVETVAPKTSVYGGMFVKSTIESMTGSAVKEEDLFKECEGSELRIFKQEGKMKRLREAEERAGQFDPSMYFKIAERNEDEAGAEDDKKKNDGEGKKSSKSKSKRKRKRTDTKDGSKPKSKSKKKESSKDSKKTKKSSKKRRKVSQ